MKRISFFLSFLIACVILVAQAPSRYYNDAKGYKGSALKTALFGIIDGHNSRSYSQLWTDMQYTDARSDGSVWDMYSNTTHYTFIEDQCGNYSGEGSCYNREHSFPKSWFNDASPMYTDLFHLYPTDGYINGMRSNYPFGETNSPSKTSNNGYSKLGPSSISGYSGTVFEPADEYKGDFARTYFYMATRYEDLIDNWDSPMLSGNSYPAYTTWAIEMLLRWAKEDPVSEKEIARNNAVYEIQYNRNPYIDFPGLEQYVWGDMKDKAFDPSNYNNPDDETETEPENPTPPTEEEEEEESSGTDSFEGIQTFNKVTSATDLKTGKYYLIVCEGENTAMSASAGDIRDYCDIAHSDGVIQTEVNAEGLPYQMTLGGSSDAYTLYDATEQVYLSLDAGKNKLNYATEASSDNALWYINISNGTTVISNKAYSNRSIQYNSGAPRFACYKSGQKAVTLYVNTTATDIVLPTSDSDSNINIYSIDGRLVRSTTNASTATDGLPKGLYIVKGKKIIIK